MSDVGTSQWIVLDPDEIRVHEFHLRLRSRPVHLGLVGATLRAVQVSREDDAGNRVALGEEVRFAQTSVEDHEGDLRTDYDLCVDVLEVQDNWIVSLEVQSNLRTRGRAILHLIFEIEDGLPQLPGIAVTERRRLLAR